MLAASSEPLWAVVVNGVFLLTLLFGVLLAVHWNDARRYWVRFGEALKDVREPLP